MRPSTGAAVVLRGDARHLPLPDASVDLVVTSPPFYLLRAYTDGGQPYPGQIGCEPTPAAYLAALLDCTREWARVLKPSGSIFVNLGDTYSGKANGGPSVGVTRRADRASVIPTRVNTTGAAPYKSLLLLPERYRIACVDELGFTARAVIVGSKVNGLPESVTDRVRRSHEDWLHLVVRPYYFAAVDRLREPHANSTVLRAQPHRAPTTGIRDAYPEGIPPQVISRQQAMHPLGALPGSVWTIASEPLVIPDQVAHARCCGGVKRDGCEAGIDHYAAFATEYARRLILGWSPSGICTACGEGRWPVVDRTLDTSERPNGHLRRRGRHNADDDGQRPAGSAFGIGPAVRGRTTARIRGEACACTPYTNHPGSGSRDHARARHGSGKTGWHPENDRGRFPRISSWREYHLDGWTPPPTRPAVVLDPFGGTGTTALVAKAHGRHGISIDRSADYCRLAAWRTTDPAQLAKALRVPPPPPQADGQLDLFTAAGDLIDKADGGAP